MNNESNPLLSLSCLIDRLNTDSVHSILNDYKRQTIYMKDNKLFNEFKNFFNANQHLLEKEKELGRADKFLFQLAYEDGEESIISKQAEDLIKKNVVDWVWMKQLNRKKIGINPNYKTLAEYTEAIMGIKLLDPNKLLTWTHNGSIRIWDLNDFSSKELNGEIEIKTKYEDDWNGEDELAGSYFISDDKLLTWTYYYMRLWNLQTGNSKIYFLDTSIFVSSALPEIGFGEIEDSFLFIDETCVATNHNRGIGILNLKNGNWDIKKYENKKSGNYTHRFLLRELKFWLNQGVNKNDIKNLLLKNKRNVRLINDEWVYEVKEIAKIYSKIYSCIEKNYFKDIKFITPNSLLTWGSSKESKNHYSFHIWNVKTGKREMSVTKLINKENPILYDDGTEVSESLNYVCQINEEYIFHSINENRLIKINFNDKLVEKYYLRHTNTITDILYNEEIGIISTSEDNTIQTFNFSNEETIFYNGHTNTVKGLIHYKEKKYISYSADNTIRFWDFDIKGKERGFNFINKVQESPFDIIDFLSIDEHTIISWTKKHITYWNLTKGTNDVIKLSNVKTVKKLNNYKIVVVHQENKIAMLDFEDGGGYKIGSHNQEIIDILIISSKNAAISWSLDGTIKLWDLENSICLMTYIFEGVENIYKISDSKYISISNNKKYRILELENF